MPVAAESEGRNFGQARLREVEHAPFGRVAVNDGQARASVGLLAFCFRSHGAIALFQNIVAFRRGIQVPKSEMQRNYISFFTAFFSPRV